MRRFVNSMCSLAFPPFQRAKGFFKSSCSIKESINILLRPSFKSCFIRRYGLVHREIFMNSLINFSGELIKKAFFCIYAVFGLFLLEDVSISF